MLKPHELVDLIKSVVEDVIANQPSSDTLEGRLGKIDPAYSSGAPKVVFDDETSLSTRTYPRLSSYTPAANDRVALLRFGSTWVIQGKVL